MVGLAVEKMGPIVLDIVSEIVLYKIIYQRFEHEHLLSLLCYLSNMRTKTKKCLACRTFHLGAHREKKGKCLM